MSLEVEQPSSSSAVETSKRGTSRVPAVMMLMTVFQVSIICFLINLMKWMLLVVVVVVVALTRESVMLES